MIRTIIFYLTLTRRSKRRLYWCYFEMITNFGVELKTIDDDLNDGKIIEVTNYLCDNYLFIKDLENSEKIRQELFNVSEEHKIVNVINKLGQN